MSNGLLIFFLLLIPLSGFIAWCGDLIGHRIGKRRHTLWNLRPRHTATLFTVGSGMCISLLSFALMWTVSETFRTMLREGETLLQANRSLRGENSELLRRNGNAERIVTENRNQISQLKSEAQKAVEETKTAQTAKEKAIGSLNRTAKLYSLAELSLNTARTGLSEEKKRLQEAQGRLTLTREDLADKRRRVSRAQAAFEGAQSRYLAAQRKFRGAQTMAIEAKRSARLARDQMESATRTAKETISFQTEKLNGLNHEVVQQDNRLAQQQGEAERKRIELSRLNAELETRRAEAENLFGQSLNTTTTLRQGKIVFRNGEEVARVTVETGTSPFRTRILLETLLQSAAANAETRGAAKSGQKRAALILPRVVRMEEGDSETRTLDEDASLQAALDAIGKANEAVVIVAVAATNTIEGEPVPLELKTFRNPLILTAGAKVAELTIDGHDLRQRVLDRLYTFLRRDVRQKLLASGAIPPLGEPSEANLVTLGGEEWLQLVGDVRRAEGSAVVTVRAAADLRAADPVRLTFEVRPKLQIGTRIGKGN